jgi:hypothetical protein
VALWLSHPGGPGGAEMQAILASQPPDAWMTVRTTPFTPDAGEPGLAARLYALFRSPRWA